MLKLIKKSSALNKFYDANWDAYALHVKHNRPEADDNLNNSNIDLIDAAYGELPEVWLVKIHGKDGVYVSQYKGETLYNFCCEAIISEYDQVLDDLLKSKDYIKGFDRLTKLNALFLVWS